VPDKPEIQWVPKPIELPAVSETRSSLIARARKDLSKLSAAYSIAAPASVDRAPEDENEDPFMLGLRYETGEDVPQDYERAAFWYRRAAEQGDGLAQNNLAALYEEGKGVTQSFELAAFWYQKAAEQGDAGAQGNLGLLYESGNGVPRDHSVAAGWYCAAAAQFTESPFQDYERAAFWYRKAAELGDPCAEFHLGQLYEIGQGVSQDYIVAATWYERSATHGERHAQFSLGRLFAEGLGIPASPERAAFWYKRSADQGNAYAQLELGRLYRDGVGVPASGHEAANWMERAIGNAPNDILKTAEYELGRLCLGRADVNGSYEKAYFWLYLSAQPPMEETAFAEARDVAAAKLKPSEILRLREEADRWLRGRPEVLFC